jgi:hypothetical protein
VKGTDTCHTRSDGEEERREASCEGHEEWDKFVVGEDMRLGVWARCWEERSGRQGKLGCGGGHSVSLAVGDGDPVALHRHVCVEAKRASESRRPFIYLSLTSPAAQY